MKNDVSTFWLAISLFSLNNEQNGVARSPLLLTDKKHISKSLGAFFFKKMASNKTNSFQSL